MNMKSRQLFLMLAICVGVFSSCSNKVEEEVKKKPNIIFIFADDQAYNTIHALGNEEIITPTLDKMVNEGTTFTNAYNMGAWNGAVCQASRAMLNTGVSVWRAQKADKVMGSWAKEGKMWGNLMQQAGYKTYMTGKWHVGTSPMNCFDSVTHIRPGMPGDAWDHAAMMKVFKDSVNTGLLTAQEVMPVGYWRPVDEADTVWQPWDKKFGGFWEGGTHWSEVLKNDALGFIDDATQQEKPFFMYLAFNAGHDPRQSPKEFIDKYPLENISLPASYTPEYPNKELIGCGPDLRDEALAPFPRTEYSVKVNRQEYFALITHMDEQINKILEAVEKSGQADNTYIFFTADHGLAIGNHGLLGKQNMYEHSMRPPLMVIGPDVPKNQKVEANVYLQDIMASTLELAGVEKPAYVEFNSLMDLAKGEKKESHYASIYGAYTNLQRMVRKDGFKLILYPKANKVMLFDLKNDPEELTDLSGDEKYAEVKKSLFEEFLKVQKEMGDPLDITSLQELI
ncbi:sulfatase-like hydrolase/transferase [Flammeovirgaceae bacterium SG7u.111]|nr:sulfatase-like hydrolase/transferase [Flammeovirgaceae bacterium SG7u.132]WPO37653.1 sulfatase-like hydrolase/transferase [Flammeovirgaceae bacterium SG7u.111]